MIIFELGLTEKNTFGYKRLLQKKVCMLDKVKDCYKKKGA